MSLLDLNMVSMVVGELNSKIKYQVAEKMDIPTDVVKNFLGLHTEGDNHTIYFLGSKLWSTEDEEQNKLLSVELEIELNSQQNFESFLKNLIQEEVKAISAIELI
jgi:hypothetical protein